MIELRMVAFALLTMVTSLCATVTFLDWWNRDRVPSVTTLSVPSDRTTSDKQQPKRETVTRQTPSPAPPPEPALTTLAPPVTPRETSSFVPPKLIKRVEPAYTREALAKKIEGTVKLSLFVTPNGNVRTIKVVKRLDTGLDRSAIEALAHWHYMPATEKGHPTTAHITEEISFHLP